MAVQLLGSLYPYQFTPNAVAGLFPKYVARVIPEKTNTAVLHSVRQSPFADEISRSWAGMIRGTVTIQGQPAKARVAALTECAPNGTTSTMSDPVTGKFTLYPLIGDRRYIVMGLDRNMRFNVEAYGQIAPVPWEDEE